MRNLRPRADSSTIVYPPVSPAPSHRSGYGYHVITRHDDGSQTLYSHFAAIYVVEAQWVAQGEAIGALGCTGYCTGTHLHFEILIGGVLVNPLAYLP